MEIIKIEFKVYFNENNKWIKRVIVSPETTNENFFRTLKIRVQHELNNIKEAIYNLTKTDYSNNIAIKEENQKYVDFLVKIRRENQVALDKLKCILLKDEHIICKHCNGLMSKKPLGVSFKKIGDTIILTNLSRGIQIEYIYSCPNCVFFVREKDYLDELKYKKQREEMIKAGEKFVPNNLGFYYRIK